MSDFKDLMRRVHLFEEHHHKDALKNKQTMIFKLYKGLLEELKEKTNINIEIKPGEFDITIFITSMGDLCVSELDFFFNKLMVCSDFKTVKVVDGKIALELWFRCWEYRDST